MAATILLAIRSGVRAHPTYFNQAKTIIVQPREALQEFETYETEIELARQVKDMAVDIRSYDLCVNIYFMINFELMREIKNGIQPVMESCLKV
jgi:hypothetical protein